MINKLTKKDIEARIDMYNEAAEHLDTCVHHNQEEEVQSRIVQRQIYALRDRFINKMEKAGKKFDR